MATRPRTALTAGDPAGIGPEIIRAALASADLPADCEITVIGGPDALVGRSRGTDSARFAIGCLEEAARQAMAGEIDAVVTGPVSKANLHREGFAFPGQTEFFAARAGVADFAMLLTGGSLTVALVTAHIPLREVADRLEGPEIARIGGLLADYHARLGQTSPRIAVAGLNPHAGESGDLGREEIEVIAPAVAALRTDWAGRAEFAGPFSPDTIFCRAAAGEFDSVLCMYHDQGLIPLKLQGFDDGVNVTLGLPFVRTSPDHGTAFDIAGKGIARPDSLLAAIRLAARMARRAG